MGVLSERIYQVYGLSGARVFCWFETGTYYYYYITRYIDLGAVWSGPCSGLCSRQLRALSRILVRHVAGKNCSYAFKGRSNATTSIAQKTQTHRCRRSPSQSYPPAKTKAPLSSTTSRKTPSQDVKPPPEFERHYSPHPPPRRELL